jgi:hypothetical protein
MEAGWSGGPVVPCWQATAVDPSGKGRRSVRLAYPRRTVGTSGGEEVRRSGVEWPAGRREQTAGRLSRGLFLAPPPQAVSSPSAVPSRAWLGLAPRLRPTCRPSPVSFPCSAWERRCGALRHGRLRGRARGRLCAPTELWTRERLARVPTGDRGYERWGGGKTVGCGSCGLSVGADCWLGDRPGQPAPRVALRPPRHLAPITPRCAAPLASLPPAHARRAAPRPSRSHAPRGNAAAALCAMTLRGARPRERPGAARRGVPAHPRRVGRAPNRSHPRLLRAGSMACG